MIDSPYVDGPAILFVDDDVGNLKVLEVHLSREFKILTCQNATDALETLEQRSDEIGLVVADQRMAGMSGTELLVKVRQLHPSIERMIITAFADLPPIIEAINSGQISGYISKPWNPTELRVILRGGAERFTLRRSLEQAHLKLLHAEQNSVLGFLAAGIGHEINNPASVVSLNLATLADRIGPVAKEWVAAASEGQLAQRREDVEEITACIEESQAAIHSLTAISRDLRVLSRLPGIEEIITEPTEVNAVVERALGFLQRQFEYRQILRSDLRATRPAQINQEKLIQTLINLGTNALHATDAVKESRTPQISVSTWDDPSGDAVLIEVEDNGQGIPEDVLPRIFDPFFTTKSGSLGLGLGLAISNNIVTRMGGKIEVDSVPGSGTSLVLHLPVGRDEAGREQDDGPDSEQAAADKDREKGLVVLVIDDDENLGRAIKKSLGRRFSVHVATGGETGIELLKQRSFDAVVCDLMMPAPDGVDVYQHLRTHDPEQLERMIFVTGGAFTSRVREFVDSVEGELQILAKPLNVDELREAVAEVAQGGEQQG